jgi:hypothetical protein
MYTLINDFMKLSKPPAEAIAKREEAVKQIIQQMGHKYRLARPMPRIQ